MERLFLLILRYLQLSSSLARLMSAESFSYPSVLQQILTLIRTNASAYQLAVFDLHILSLSFS